MFGQGYSSCNGNISVSHLVTMMHLTVYVIPDFDLVFGSVVDERHAEIVLDGLLIRMPKLRNSLHIARHVFENGKSAITTDLTVNDLCLTLTNLKWHVGFKFRNNNFV